MQRIVPLGRSLPRPSPIFPFYPKKYRSSGLWGGGLSSPQSLLLASLHLESPSLDAMRRFVSSDAVCFSFSLSIALFSAHPQMPRLTKPNRFVLHAVPSASILFFSQARNSGVELRAPPLSLFSRDTCFRRWRDLPPPLLPNGLFPYLILRSGGITP